MPLIPELDRPPSLRVVWTPSLTPEIRYQEQKTQDVYQLRHLSVFDRIFVANV